MKEGLSRSQKRAQTQANNDTRAVLENPAAVRFLCRVLDQCGYYGDPMTGNSETFYRLGKRATGLDIMRNLEAVEPNAHLMMLQAAAKQREANSPRKEEANDED